MLLFLKFIPLIPLIFIAYLLSVRLNNKANKNINEARGIETKLDKKDLIKRQIQTLDNNLYAKSNKKVKSILDKQMDWLIKKGNPYNLNIATYYLTKIPGLLFLFIGITSQINFTGKLAFFSLSIISLFYVEIKYYEKNKDDYIEITKDLFKIYNQLDVMSYADVTIHQALIESSNIIKNKRFKKAYVEMTAYIIETKNIPEAMEKMGEKFDMNEIDSFVTTITQGIETGKIRSMIANQRNIINKRYLGAKDIETEKKQGKVSLGVLLLALSIMGIVLYSFFVMIIDKLSTIFI